MILGLYEGVMTLAAPLLEWRLARRALSGKEDPERLAERRGVSKLARPDGELVWLHAASVGESTAALALVERLLDDAPDRHVLVTTGTVTSATLIRQRLPTRAMHQFVPVDRPAWVRCFLDHWRPDLVLVVESDFWPAQLSNACARGIPIILVNGRISAKTFRCWRLAGRLARPLFTAFDLVLATNRLQADRFATLGSPRVRVSGNLKRAARRLPVDASAAEKLDAQIAGRQIWLAASTHEGEDTPILEAHLTLRRRFPGFLTVISPRHPERGGEIAENARARGLQVARRSAEDAITPATELYVADTLGELALFFQLAPIVFIAGSLVPVGGHNPIEPAHFDCAILFGPLMSKNAETAREMVETGAALELVGAAELAPAVTVLLQDASRRMSLARNARRYASDGLPVLDDLVAGITPFLRSPCDEGLA